MFGRRTKESKEASFADAARATEKARKGLKAAQKDLRSAYKKQGKASKKL
jgi:hypothetical protein